ncbi:hypothetical protein ILYODFUR_036107 [Ilyodon furcidens]|uniref:Uncharacterized protein n=1 Tax=Ilyodon furcidens TaxID=33524 RepID=A0ABV0VLH0_9TELE
MQEGSKTQGTTGFSLSQPNLPTPRLMVLVCLGLALSSVVVPFLPVVLAVFLAPGAPSLCLVAVVVVVLVVVVPPAALEAMGTAVLCCFLAGASRGRTWFVREGGLVTHLS